MKNDESSIVRIIFVLFIIMLLPFYMSSGNATLARYSNIKHPVVTKNIPDITILASVPSGSPINVDDLRCQLAKCSGYGVRLHPVYQRLRMHQGIDLAAAIGTPVVATGYGIVSKTEYKRIGYGVTLEISHGEELSTRYAHLSKILVHEGDQISAGDTIALVGNSGLSTGPHLHFEVLRKKPNGSLESLDPRPFILK